MPTSGASRVRTTSSLAPYVDPQAGKVTFQAYAEEWRRIQPHAEGTEQSVEQHLRLHVDSHIGDRPIAAIRPSEIQALVSKSTVAASTTEVIYGRVVAVFRAAVRDRIIAESPCVDIRLPKPPRRVDNVLTPVQVVALADPS
jgi:hypothetical protein